MTRAREAHAFADVVNKFLGVLAIAYIVFVIGAHSAGSHGLSKLAAGCPDLELCLLQGRLPCIPSADSIEAEAGEQAQCGPCLPHYHQLGGKCISETKMNLKKSLLNAILKTALSDEQSQVERRQPSHNRLKTTTSALLTVKQINTSNRSEPLPLPSAGGRQAPMEEQQADQQHQPTSSHKIVNSSTLTTARSSQHLLVTEANLPDAITASSPVASPSPYAPQQSTGPMVPLLRVQQQPPIAAAVMSAERVLMGRHESVAPVDAAMHDGGGGAASAAASSAAGNKASGVDGLGKLSHLLFFVLVLSACLLTAVLLTAASVVWYRLRIRRGHLRKNRACEEADRPLPAECRPLTSRLLWQRNNEILTTTRAAPERKHRRALTVAVGDGKLAQSALRYHYERSKLQMLSSSSLSSLQHDRSTTSDNNDSSDDDNEALSGNQDPVARANTPDEEYTVYECPGLAPTSELEVHNPLFETKCHRSSSGGSNVGQP